jgi:hypothetical protein
LDQAGVVYFMPQRWRWRQQLWSSWVKHAALIELAIAPSMVVDGRGSSGSMKTYVQCMFEPGQTAFRNLIQQGLFSDALDQPPPNRVAHGPVGFSSQAFLMVAHPRLVEKQQAPASPSGSSRTHPAAISAPQPRQG